ncbi:MAG: hypothetical protein ACI8UZ_001123 [Akkermansiaceae bacterium]|jgi:hypothetical protein
MRQSIRRFSGSLLLGWIEARYSIGLASIRSLVMRTTTE